MNRIYHSIWNATLGTWVAAPETARTSSSRGSSTCVAPASSAAFLPTWKPLAAALAMGLVSLQATAASEESINVPAGYLQTILGAYHARDFTGGQIGVGGMLLVDVATTLRSTGTLDNDGMLSNLSTLINHGAFNNNAGSQLVNAGGLELQNNGTLTNNGTINNNGSRLLNNSFGTLNNNGSLVNVGGPLDNYGTLHNNTGGTLENTGLLSNYHTLNNSGDLTNYASLSNANEPQATPGSGLFNTGTLTNHGALYNGTIANSTSVLSNSGTLINDGTLTNYAQLVNTGLLDNISALTNTATGTLQVGAGGTSGTLRGNVTNHGTLVFNRSDTSVYDGAVSGTGSVQKNGVGTLLLSGNSSSFSGNTWVNQGTLLLNGTAKLGGDLTVVSGATLAGTGSLGGADTVTTIQGGGTIAPGLMAAASSPYGTLRVLGDLVLKAGSTYAVQADPNSDASSLIKVAGTATLAGSALHVGVASNPATDYQVGKTYTILEASRIVDTFDRATSSYAYLDAALSYSPNAVTLQLQRKNSNTGGGNMEFADLATSPNQGAVATAISSLPSDSALYRFVETLPAGTPAPVLASLSGDAHSNVDSGLAVQSALVPSITSNHLRNNMTAGMAPGAPVAQSDGPLPASAWPSSKALPAWAEVVGHWQRYDGDGNAATLKQRTYGLFLGMDEEVGTSGWRLGGSLGYTNADGRVNARSSTSKVDSYSGSVYGGKSFGTGTGPRINVLGGLAYTWHDIETTRKVDSLGQTLKADYSAHTAQLFAEVGYAIGQYDKVGFEPFVGVSLGQQRSKGFQEKGGFAALSGQSSTDDLASTTLGLRMHSNFQLAGKDARLRATVGWRHAFGDVTAEKTMAFEGGQNFTVAGSPLSSNTAVLGLEGEVALSRTAALVLGYRGEMGSGQRDHAANVKLRWAF